MNKELIKNDFYDYVTGKWQKETKIPSDWSSISSYSELHLQIEKELRKMVQEWSTNKRELPNNNQIHEMVKFYKMAKNTKMQTKLGWSPVQNELEIIENLKDWNDFEKNFKLLRKISSWMPYVFSVGEDFIDNKIYTFWITKPSLILPSREYYSLKKAKDLIKTIKEAATKLMKSLGKKDSEIKRILKNAFEADRQLVEYSLTSEEKNKVELLYNPYTATELEKVSTKFPLLKQAQELVKTEIDQIVSSDKKYLDNLDKIYNELISFEQVKDLMYLKTILSIGSYLTPETRDITFEIKKAITGAKELAKPMKWAYLQATSWFSEPLSLYYGKSNFSENERQDVLKMIDKIIKVYQNRLSKNTWLSPQTIEKAISKLNKIKPMVGYPEYIYSYYDNFTVTDYKDGGSLTSNINKFSEIIDEYLLTQYKKEVDQNIWGMASYEVNAYFNPLSNRIVFPAGYLKAPFYDYNQNSSANYGGLGMTIGHEISHAFDNNGAQFDENGSFENWWTPEDYEAFREKTQAMIKAFNGYETKYGKINGSLTVSENIADQGGLISALEAAKTEKDFDIEKFFEGYAWCERAKTRPEAAIQRLLTDPHSPAKERVNIQMKIFAPFQKHYELEPGDALYTDPKDICEIW
ncbi:M13 family peptidase [Mycoplasmopsis pullorum]|uniref:M13 family metallopeptidase n=1 Tax=Mycoplasmopsis pullorum TaxID=48003 RepID=UPI00111A214E|nr:M13 family metallopeptidase [Mycoplasmopsis pullorum]TNK82600.1 M13 family peptidase [Mycoplasmopsis pullorum]TNK83499.1 M13 family peptidase [Mycoplasmopsis pullorum]TNK84704.1 M13 family peptidase [Mycoplasmopsis pullorum]TNK85735.1 M13 family peptidase [Mycoplasmopsis pullorum]TNK86276.1 M13 family peptidase [Mycoplasmopsis pullorum]